MTKKCKKCGGPLRYLGTANINCVLVVGAECHDEKCKGTGVFTKTHWIESLVDIGPIVRAKFV